MHYLVYKVTCLINGKTYIGCHKTKNIDDNYMGSGKYLKRAIEKNGLNNFQKEILFDYDNAEDMFAKEAELVNEEYLSEGNTYNLKKGGSGGFDYVNSTGANRYYRKNNPRVLAAQQKATKKQYELRNTVPGYLDKIKKNVSRGLKEYYKTNPASFLGKKHSDNTKKQLSDSQKKIDRNGIKNPSFGTMWITNGSQNKKVKKQIDIPEGWYKGRI